ncbi:GNAT family N-acetyltransferase [soil metagenome]|jgi:ribosomal protein S18 acetylase RimI-like enzyme
MQENTFVVRPAEHRDEPSIADLVVEGFLDKFRPIFGRRMERSTKIMERWVRLEHSLGGVRSLVIEGAAPVEIVASVGVRTDSSDDEALARGIWETLRQNLGFFHASWAASLLSYPRYTAASSSEAYIERLVVANEYRRRGVARIMLDAAETLARESGKRTVGLHVSGSNFPALKLYEACGYEEVSRQRSLLTGYFLGIREWLYLQKEL